MTYFAHVQNGPVEEHKNWDEVVKHMRDVSFYANPNEVISAHSLLRAGGQMYSFSYGFNAFHVTTFDPRG